MSIDLEQFYFKGKHAKWRDQGLSDEHFWPDKNQSINPRAPSIQFESLSRLVEYVRGLPPTMPIKWGTEKGAVDINWSWNHNTNDVIALYDKGWDQGFAAIQYMMEQTAVAAMAALREQETITADVSGSYVDVPAFLKGVPENMYEFHTEIQEVLHLDVELDWYINWNVPADELMYRGIAVMSAIMALRRLGVFVDLYARLPGSCRSNVSDGRYTQHEIRVDMMAQHITENLSEVLLAVAHPAFYRQIVLLAFGFGFGSQTYGLCGPSRDAEDFIPKPGTGKVVIPGHYIGNSLRGAKELGLDFENSWASPNIAAGLVKMMFTAAKPINR